MELKEKQSIKVESSSFYDRVLARTFNLVFTTVEKLQLDPTQLIGKKTMFQMYLESFDEAKSDEEFAFIFEAMAYKANINPELYNGNKQYNLYDILLGRAGYNEEVKNHYKYLKDIFSVIKEESNFIEALKAIYSGLPFFARLITCNQLEPSQIIADIFKDKFKKELELGQVFNEESRFYSNKTYQVNATSSIDEKGNVTFAAAMKSHDRNLYRRDCVSSQIIDGTTKVEKIIQYICERAKIISKTETTSAAEFINRNTTFCFNADWIETNLKTSDILYNLYKFYPLVTQYHFEPSLTYCDPLKNIILPKLFSLAVLGKDEEMCMLAAGHGLLTHNSSNHELNQIMGQLSVPIKALFVSAREGKRCFFKAMIECGLTLNNQIFVYLNLVLAKNCPDMYLQLIEIILESGVALSEVQLYSLTNDLNIDLKKQLARVVQKHYSIIEYNAFCIILGNKELISLKTEDDFITVMQVWCKEEYIEALLDEKHDAEFIVNVLDNLQDETVIKIVEQMVANLPKSIFTAKQIERFANVVGDERLYSVFTSPENDRQTSTIFYHFWESKKIIPLGNKDAMKEIIPYLQKIYRGYPSVYHLINSIWLLDAIVCQPFKSYFIFINDTLSFAKLEKLCKLPGFDLKKVEVVFEFGFPSKKLSDPNIDEGLKEVIALEYFYREESSAFYDEGKFLYLAEICLKPQQCKKYILKGDEYKERLYHIFTKLPRLINKDDRYDSNLVDCALQFKKDFCAVYFEILAQEKNLNAKITEDKTLIISIIKTDQDSCKFNKESILPKTKEFLVIAKKIYEEYVENNNSNSQNASNQNASNQNNWQLHLKNIIEKLEKTLVLQPQITQFKTEQMIEV